MPSADDIVRSVPEPSVAARNVTLETDRLVLRLPRREDVDAFVPIVADEETMRWVGGVRDRARVEASIERWLRRWSVDGFGHFIVIRRDDGAFLGQIGLTTYDQRDWVESTVAAAGEHARVEMGWMIDRAYWGAGYAGEAARAVRDWTLAAGVPPLVSQILPGNERSERIAMRLGAHPTGGFARAGVPDPGILWVYPTPRSPWPGA